MRAQLWCRETGLEELGRLSGIGGRNGDLSLGNQNSAGKMGQTGMRRLARVATAWPVPSAGGADRPLLQVGSAMGQPWFLL